MVSQATQVDGPDSGVSEVTDLGHELFLFNHILMFNMFYSRTSLIQSPEGHGKVSVLERSPFYRGHHDDVTFKTPLTVSNLVTKNRHTHHTHMHLNLLIYSVETLSYRRTKQLTTQCCI